MRALAFLAPVLAQAAGAPDPLSGLEKKLLESVDPARCERFLSLLAEDPRVAGTPRGERAAAWVRSRFLDFGFDAAYAAYDVYLPLPKSVEIELVAPETAKIETKEEGWEWDKDSFTPDAILPYNAYSPSGEVSGELVYANYGLSADYRRLGELGVDVRGKIVLARYGRSFRGVKARLAHKHGAAGLILYSDPADDGYVKGDVYPRGPWRPASAIQRGSILDISSGPGDPLSPGWAALEGARRIDPSQAEALPRIPTTPIGYGEAEKLLRRLAGPGAPEGWQGGLAFPYHVGPGPARVRMKLEMDFADRTIRNVIARIEGSEFPDEWILLGNHRDAWVHGAVDAGSGGAILLEVARVLGELRAGGWSPRRTILLCSWDAEEFGLLGSTEWVEEHLAEIREKAVAYLNVDSAVTGPDFAAGGSPSLAGFLRSVARDVEVPRLGRSVHDLWTERTRRAGDPREDSGRPEEADRGPGGDEPPVGPIGSGSDFTAFLDHAGVACLDLSSTGPYGVYHSIHDTFYWMKQFGDPAFEAHATMSRVLALAAMRLSEGDLLPLAHDATARAVGRYLDDIAKVAAEAAAADRRTPPALDAPFESVRRAAERLARAAAAAVATIEPGRAAETNASLLAAEREYLDDAGLPGRPWFRSLLQAPGLETGYAPATLPGLREAVLAGDEGAIRREASRLAARLEAAALVLERRDPAAARGGSGSGPSIGGRRR